MFEKFGIRITPPLSFNIFIVKFFYRPRGIFPFSTTRTKDPINRSILSDQRPKTL